MYVTFLSCQVSVSRLCTRQVSRESRMAHDSQSTALRDAPLACAGIELSLRAQLR